MIHLIGSSVPDRAAIETALAEAADGAPRLADLGPADGRLSLDVTDWGPAEIAEVLAPLADGRIPKDESAEYLASVSLVHRLATRLDDDDRTLEPDVAQLHGALGDQLRRDCASSWVWEAWADAACAEDDAARPTVSTRTLEWLGGIETAAGRPPPADPSAIHHAGALHTYGYLCSSLWTKYGWKRTRWVSGAVAAAAGIDHGLLQPVPRSGTLLSNATTLAARLLGWNATAEEGWNDDVRPTARALGRVIEVATSRRGNDGDELPLLEPLVIRTSLFRRDDPPPNRAPNLLVYTVERGGVEQVVTLFDVGDAKVADLLHPPAEEVGHGVEVRLRYNALADGVGTRFSGSRRIEKPS